MGYNYKSLKDIDKETLDYLEFVTPKPLKKMKIDEVNNFLTLLDKAFLDLDSKKESLYTCE